MNPNMMPSYGDYSHYLTGSGFYCRSEEEAYRARREEAKNPVTNRQNFQKGLRNMLDDRRTRKYKR